MHSSKLKKMTAALCMALIPISVFAAGLGKLNVISGLGEPLRADIELLAVTPEELNAIVATIASEEAYANQGIERPASHNTIKIDIAKNASGTPILKLKSTQPISEPFLDMLIQVDWASGRLLREYTVLLDPPGYVAESSTNQNSSQGSGSSVQTAQVPVIRSTSSTANTNNNVATGTATQNRKPSRNARTKPLNTVESEESTGPIGPQYVTQRGDSLAKIARNMQIEGVSLDQMLVGLYNANPNAFEGKNINRLKVGKIIRQPTEQELTAISRQQASKEVKVQSANWNAYRNKLAGIVADSVANDTEESAQSATGKIKSTAEDQSAPAQAGPKDVVKLSAGEAALTKKEAENVKSLQAKITALQEESTAREKSVKEAQEKTAALEKQIQDMQKLLALKNGAMADIQKQAEAQAAQDKAALDKAAQDKIAPDQTNLQQAPAAEPTTAPAVNATEPATDNTTVNTPSTAPSSETKKSEVNANPVPVIAPEAVEESDMLDGLDLPLLGGALGLFALLGGGWMLLRNKRKRNLADFEQGIMTSGGLKANTVFGNTSGSSVDTGDTSFLTDFSQSANGGMIDTNDVDPIAEAEVYMAYGRDAQAEEILKDAISKEPKRYELHLKLLEMYAASKSISSFETIAGELYTTLGPEDPTWAKVAEIGQKLEPNNPLYQENTAHSTHSEKAQDDKLDANDFSDSPIARETDLDFSFDNDALSHDFASPVVAETSALKATNLDENSDLNHLNLEDSDFFKDETLNPEKLDDTISLNVNSNVEPSISDDLISNTNIDSTQAEQNAVPLSEISAKEATANLAIEEGLDFDFGQLTSSPDVSTNADKSNTDEGGFGKTMPGLDMSGFSKPQSDSSNLPTLNSEELNAPSSRLDEVDFSSIHNDFGSFKLPTEDAPVLTSPSSDENASSGTEFNFNLSTLSPEAASYVDEPETNANTFDLSGISLEMQDSESNQSAQPSIAEQETANEPIEIETKLDLVAAYLDMDDKEGAKELLDEVIKEGGASQRKRAEALLAKIG